MMETDNALGVQNSFFNQARKDRTRVSVLLTNGQRINGTIKAFDKFTVLLDTKSGEQIVFKHAVATIGPFRPVEGAARAPQREREGAVAERKGFGNFLELPEKK